MGSDETVRTDEEEEEDFVLEGRALCSALRCTPSLLPPTSHGRLSERGTSLGGAMVGDECRSDGSVLEGISLFFGGRHSLLRSWLDFILMSAPLSKAQAFCQKSRLSELLLVVSLLDLLHQRKHR